MKTNVILSVPSVIMSVVKNLLFIALLTSCDKWTAVEPEGINFAHPWDQNPALWEKYKASLRDYKSRDHYLFYARFDNAPEKATSEKDFMRCLPDSLDYVSLTNADNFSDYDREDLAWMKSIGTKVLYQVDLTAKGFTSTGELNSYLDKVLASVKENNMDGYSFTGSYRLADAQNDALASFLVSKLSAAKTTGQMLVFEGNPLFVPEADRNKVDLFILDSEATAHAQELRFQVLAATGYAGVPASKLLLGADINGTIQDEERVEHPAVEELTRRVVSFGPLAGLGVYHIGDDYYSYDGNYVTLRAAIQLLNPSK